MGERRLHRFTPRQGPVAPTNTDNAKRSRADAPRSLNNLKASVGKHREGCGRPNHERDECKQRDVPGWNEQGRWIDSKAYKTIDAQNTASGQGDRHPVLLRALVTATSRVSFQEDSSKAGNKYGPAGDKSSKYKSSRYSSDKDGKHKRGHRGHGGTTLPSHTLLHITCDCDDTDIDTMYSS